MKGCDDTSGRVYRLPVNVHYYKLLEQEGFLVKVNCPFSQVNKFEDLYGGGGRGGPMLFGAGLGEFLSEQV